MSEKRKGRVKFYNKEKGFGFIEIEGEKDVHFGRDSFKGNPPREGDIVEFEVIAKPKGKHAINLKIIKKSGTQPTISQTLLNYKVPFDTKDLLKNYEDIDNFNLKFNKFSNWDNGKFIIFTSDNSGNIKYKINANFSSGFLKKIFDSYYQSIKKLNMNFKEKELSTQWKMVIGLGSPSVYETSMTLHHIYGFPYIPGQAVKGVVRSYIIQEAFNSDEGEALTNEDFVKIFGDQKHKGNVTFFDAYPLENLTIDIDVMNVHYPDYYNGNKPPADYQNPNPIYFLVVKNTKFKFLIGSKSKNVNDFKVKSKSITEWFEEALKEYGIGAKTSVGYGVMG